MKKLCLCFCILVFTLPLVAGKTDISWNRPALSSQNFLSFLQENEEKITVYPAGYETNEKDFYFAFESWQHFKKALNHFFLDTEKKRDMIQYETSGQNNAKDDFPSQSNFSISFFTGLDWVFQEKKDYYFFYFGSHLEGSLNRKLDFYATWWKGHFARDLDYAQTSLIMDTWIQTNDDSTQTYLDNVKGRIQYQFAPWLNLAIGRGNYVIGNNIGGSIILNDFSNDYGYFSSNLKLKNISLDLIHANLLADSLVANDYPNKYLAIHQMKWQPNSKLDFFIGESIIYGERALDINYMIPLTFWRLVEHNLHDRDNVLIFGGMNLNYTQNDLFYFNLILDELSKSQIFKKWWGNKYAAQIGYSHLFGTNHRLSLEFTAIRPWIYTHNFMHLKYSHESRPLGFPEGSNLIQFAGEWNLPIISGLQLNNHVSFTRQGSVGNDFSLNYDGRDPNLDDDTDWLEGEITNKYTARTALDWHPLAHHRFKLAFLINKTADSDWTKELYFGYQARY
jgi:hypothetical protein